MCQMLVIWSMTSAGAMTVYHLIRQAALCQKGLLMVIDFEMWSWYRCAGEGRARDRVS